MKKYTGCLSFFIGIVLSLSSFAQIDVGQAVKSGEFNGGVALLLEPASPEYAAALKKLVPNSMIHICVKDQKQVDSFREYLYNAKLLDSVTVDLYDGKNIPFVTNFVNLIVTGKGVAVSRDEVLRSLAPLGKALLGEEVVTKPRPDEMDDWPQYLYDATGNAVSNDTMLHPPLFHSQWTGGPRWSRHHETMSSISGCVSGDSKIYYIFDEGNPFSPYLPSDWKVICRDAFNGTILWKRDISRWMPRLTRLKSGPSNLPRRLVYHDKKLYVTLGIEAPVSVLDTVTGKTIKILVGTDNTEEIVYEDGKLYLVADQLKIKPEIANSARYKGTTWDQREKKVICYDLLTDKIIWQKAFKWVAPLSLAMNRNKAFFFDGSRVVSLDKGSGEKLWESSELPVFKKMATFFAPKLVVQGGVVMFAGGEGYTSDVGSRGNLTGISTENGKTMWTAPNPASGYKSPEDLFVVDGKAWAGDVTYHRWTKSKKDATGEITGVNLSTGSVDEKYPQVEAYWFHHRCHMAKATKNYMILNRTGTEFVNFKTGKWTLHNWTRGACLYGSMPANGMLYLPQHPCACNIGAKTFGFTVLSPKDENHPTRRFTPEAERLTTEKEAPLADLEAAKADEWPTYRGDIKRSGSNSGVKVPVKQEWRVKLDGDLTQPIVAENKVLVSLKDKNTLVAVDAANGKFAWKFLPGGKIDSSPTVYKKRVYFGSADGFIYCLDINDGSLFWKYQVAPTNTKHMWFEKIEATHPVHGNVLVMNDKVYTVAGRNMFTDGGLRFLILDAATGKKISENIMGDKVPGSDEELQMCQEFLNMPMALSDLLSTNGKKIFMRFQQFDMNGKRLKIDYTRKLYGIDRNDIAESAKSALTDQKGQDAHLFSATGFTDDSWWHRTYWIFGKHQASGWPGYFVAGRSGAPAGRMITFNDKNIFTWGRMKYFFKWSLKYEYYLHAKDYDYNEIWGGRLPILARSMLLSDNKLFILGPEELERQGVVDKQITNASMEKEMQEQLDAYIGKNGCKMIIVDPTNGKILSGLELDSAPVFDGMSGAYGKVYVSMLDGTLRCLGGAGSDLKPIGSEKIEFYNKDAAALPKPPVKKKRKKKSNKK